MTTIHLRTLAAGTLALMILAGAQTAGANHTACVFSIGFFIPIAEPPGGINHSGRAFDPNSGTVGDFVYLYDDESGYHVYSGQGEVNARDVCPG